METWNYTPEGRGIMFSDEMDLPIDAFGRDRKILMEWDGKPSYNFENNGFVTEREADDSLEFMDLGLADMMRKPCHSSSGMDMFSTEAASDSSKRAASPVCVIASSFSFTEQDSGSKISRSVMEATCHDSSLIALKLGSLADCGDPENGKLSERPVLSSVHPALLAKKARAKGSYLQPPFCQVLGCNMDLSSSKDYHKRHKVCDIHSKTDRVIVNGIEQRFCQQCSRFHLLSEFDDNKRSCRRRLAGHNERRRKPQFDSLCGKQQKLTQSYQVSKQKLSGSYYSSCALSLLSDHSQDFSSNSAGVPVTHSLMMQSSSAFYDAGQIRGRYLRVRSTENVGRSGFSSNGMSSEEANLMDCAILNDANHSVGFKVHAEGGFMGCFNAPDPVSFEHGPTVDLIQLSSHLQRVEQQRHTLQVKQENAELCCFPTV